VGNARAVYDGSIVIDGRDPTFLTERQVPLAKAGYWDALTAGGVTAVVVDVPWTTDGFLDGVINFGSWHERIAASDGRGVLVESADDIPAAKAAGVVGVILSSQTPTIFEDDLRLLRPLRELGLRVTQLAYQRRTLVGDSCGESADNDGGLSLFGRAVVAELNRLGIAIDLSHASDATMEQAIEVSTEPVFFSHSNARAVVEHRRNVPDAILRRLADRGGICCVSAYSDFLVSGGSNVGTSTADMARMVRVLANIIGVDHVGFGLDVGEFRTAEEVALIGGSSEIEKRYSFLSRVRLPEFADSLANEGFNDAEIEGVLGSNLLRFFRDVWKT
jgi:membrane dipeptidase